MSNHSASDTASHFQEVPLEYQFQQIPYLRLSRSLLEPQIEELPDYRAGRVIRLNGIVYSYNRLYYR